ncbi:hypothetical protein [Frigoribacterium sp. ACAM 257]|uniref:hypothetical protein n=1 Tax=Frigoribacterium sp. ACAM 257 TaxID=2508998 RepID=UPI00174E9078|nr:hypothetical protein [Frigoribacterium sp. ACAM 257]
MTIPQTTPQQTAGQQAPGQQAPQQARHQNPPRAPHQSKYQVRLDQGVAGAARIAPGAHVVVVADVLDGHGLLSTADVLDAVTAVADDAAIVLHATAASSADVARRVLDRQAERGDRAVVAVVAAGALDDDGFRSAVEDVLAAGAVVDALAASGIDFSSPEAAVACAAAVSLRRAQSHLLTASSSAAELVEAGREEALVAAGAPVAVATVHRAPLAAEPVGAHGPASSHGEQSDSA